MSEAEETYDSMSDEEFMQQSIPEDSSIETSDSDSESIEAPEENFDESSANVPEEEYNGSEDENLASDEYSDTESTSEDTQEEIDYKEAYTKLTSPFKASNRQVQVNSVDDALNLMRQGVDYTRKMQSLKPNLKLMKMLQNNEMLDEEKLSFMIDLQRKNPEAIRKFLKEAEIDPLDIDTEEEVQYQPSNYSVSDKEVELDEVVQNIKDTPSFQDTIDIVTNKLDASSKKILSDTPKLIETINDHVNAGVYHQIMAVVENERMLGRLTNMNDLEAYKHVGDVIHANGGFNTPPQANNISQNTSLQAEQQRNNRRKAASPSKGTKAKNQNLNFDPMQMSDEDFMKATNKLFTEY